MFSFNADPEKIKEVKMGMNLVDGQEYKSTLAAIAYCTADVLVKTLGPYASTTTIDDGTYTYPTKDGWAVCNRLRFGDAIQNTLFKFIRDISFRLNSKVGDGTTTAIIAASKFIEILNNFMEQCAMSESKSFRTLRQADLLDAIDNAKNDIIAELMTDERCKKIDRDGDMNEIYKIAYVSSNRNETIAKLIQEIYQETKNPNIHVTMSGSTKETIAEVERGYKLDAELLDANCYINTSDKTYDLNLPSTVVVFDHNVSYSDHMSIINTLVLKSNQEKKNLIIVAPYYDEVFRSIISMQVQGLAKSGKTANIALVKLPMASTSQKNYAGDFAAIIGTQLVDFSKVTMFNQMVRQANGEENEYDEYKDLMKNSGFESPEDILKYVSANVNHIILSSSFMMIKDYDTSNKSYQMRMDEIKSAYDEAKSKADASGFTLSKNYMDAHLRYIKFIGDTGIIRVGGDSDLVKQCSKDSIDDAVLACRSAYENGYIRGLNIETISASAKLFAESCEKVEKFITEDAGSSKEAFEESLRANIYRMIAATFSETSKEVMRNKYRDDNISDDEYTWGAEDNYSMDEVLAECINNNLCFDIVTEEFEPAGQSLVNSVSTDCEILSAMSSILSLLLSSDQLLSLNKLYDKKSGRAQILADKTDEAYAVARGYANAFKESGCALFGDFYSSTLESEGDFYTSTLESDMDDEYPDIGMPIMDMDKTGHTHMVRSDFDDNDIEFDESMDNNAD